MKKSFLILFMALAASAIAANAAPGIKSIGESKYSISVGNVEMIVNAGEGGKILSYKFDGKEVIETRRINPFSYGSTFWSSPQKEWNWPPVKEYDRDPYEIEERENSLFLTSPVSPKYQYRFTKEFRIDPEKETIIITYSIKNESDVEKQVAPWEITRVPSEGLVFFDCPVENIEAAQGELIKFNSEYGISWYKFDEAPANRKINADGQGWLAYTDNNVLMVKTFDNITPAMPAPGEAEIQVYVNAGSTYTELEAQGAYKELKPGESLVWSVKWYLAPADASEPSKALVKQVKKITSEVDLF